LQGAMLSDSWDKVQGAVADGSSSRRRRELLINIIRHQVREISDKNQPSDA
jgi:hypothetical protein